MQNAKKNKQCALFDIHKENNCQSTNATRDNIQTCMKLSIHKRVSKYQYTNVSSIFPNCALYKKKAETSKRPIELDRSIESFSERVDRH